MFCTEYHKYRGYYDQDCFKGTQAWDNLDFFYLNKIYIYALGKFSKKKFASFPSIFARISKFEHFRGDWAYAEPNFFGEICTGQYTRYANCIGLCKVTNVHWAVCTVSNVHRAVCTGYYVHLAVCTVCSVQWVVYSVSSVHWVIYSVSKVHLLPLSL